MKTEKFCRQPIKAVFDNFDSINGRVFWGSNQVCGMSRAGQNYILILCDGNKTIVKNDITLTRFVWANS